jgi:hypothetical protein
MSIKGNINCSMSLGLIGNMFWEVVFIFILKVFLYAIIKVKIIFMFLRVFYVSVVNIFTLRK